LGRRSLRGTRTPKAFDKAMENSKYELATLYGIRGGFQFVGAILTLMLTLSYCSPTMAVVSEKIAQRWGAKVVGHAAKKLLVLRGALFLATIEVSIFMLAITVLTWTFEDDLLEKWCKRSAFGLERKRERLAFTSAEKQGLGLADALVDIAR
jgi:hypothetical protein